MRTVLGLVAVMSLVACGDDGGKGGGDAAPEDGGGTGDGSPSDATADGPDIVIDAPPGMTALRVRNYFAWCTVSVNGAATSIDNVQDVNVPPGDITLVAMRRSATYEVSGNMWHHTNGDTGDGEPGVITNENDPATKTSTAVVTVGSTAKCVWVCCPYSSTSAGCGPTMVGEQCQ
jgi:hypothetical protein